MTPTADAFLAVFLGSKTSPKAMAWMAMSDAEREAKEKEGIAAWKAWIEKHQDKVFEIGGPLGRTKAISADGIRDISNNIGAFMVVRAASHQEAAKMFENHPHFAIFPGESVEVMPVMPIPPG